MILKFNLERLFREKIAIHCQTKNQAEKLSEIIKNYRNEDNDGASINDDYELMPSLWDSYGVQTCYSFYEGFWQVASMSYFTVDGINVVEADDIIYEYKRKSKFMKKYKKVIKQ